MADTVLPPSPNWYLSNILVVTVDGTIIYGSSSNDITILTPIINTENKQRFKINIICSAHKKRVLCLAASPDWQSSQNFVSGSEDGIVKLWNRSTLSFSIAHNLHLEANDSVVGVTFLNEREVVSVGSVGFIVLWNTQQNTVKSDNKVIKMYKPLCVSVCPLKQNTIAIGTKQGVVLVLSVTDKFMILFKAHGHDTEITSLSWCPTSYCDPLEKIVAMKRHKVKTFRVRKISNKKSDISNKSVGNTNDSGLYQQSSGEEADESDIFDVNKDTEQYECTELSDSDCDNVKKNNASATLSKDHLNLSSAMEKIELANKTNDLEKNESFVEDCKKLLNIMNSKKSLKASGESFIINPDDSEFNESQGPALDESDIFDIYEEPPLHEFGHSKYIPEEIVVAQGQPKEKAKSSSDFLEECKKLESTIKGETKLTPLKKRAEATEAVDQTLDESVLEKSDIFDVYKDPPVYEFGHEKYMPTLIEKSLDPSPEKPSPSSDFLDECQKLREKIILAKSDDKSSENESVSLLSSQVNKLNLANSDDSPTKVEESSETQTESRDGNYLFLASVCKNGKVCIWKWGGNLVLSADVVGSREDKLKKAGLPWGVVNWLSSKMLLVASKSAHLFRCNFNCIYPKSKSFGFSLVHDEHVRGLYCIASSSNNEVETSSWRNRQNSSLVWTVGQDRLLIAYSPDENKVVTKINTFGGFITSISVSSIDPNRFAITCGDGMVRIWDYSPKCAENNGMGEIKMFWLNVQGKVQACDWHPTKENLVAFGNGEGRVGLIDCTSQNSTKLLPASLSLGVHGLLWGPDGVHLYAHGTGKLVMYNTAKLNQEPVTVNVTIMNRKWEITAISWSDEYFTVGSKEGGVAILKPEYPHENITYSYPHRKLITSICWHPLAVTSEDSMSPCADLVAVSANSPTVVVLRLVFGDDGGKLEVYDEILYHSLKVNRVCWSPHHSGRLLSVSSDKSAQVYDVINKCPLHTLVGHVMSVLCCVWSPVEANLVMTAGEDFSLRVWNIDEHPYQEIKIENSHRRRKMKLAALEIKPESIATVTKEGDGLKKNKIVPIQEVNQVTPEANGVLAQVVRPKSGTNVASQSALCLYWRQTKDRLDSIEGCKRLFTHHISKVVDKNVEAEIDCSGGFDYLKIYGSHNELCHYLNLEQEKSENASHNYCNSWMRVGLLKGDLKTVIENAKNKNQISPSLLCLAPIVSLRFWKDMMSSYKSQKDKSKDNLGADNPSYALYQGIVLLANGDLEEACEVLMSADLIVDALVAAKYRHSEKLANDCMHKLILRYKKHGRLNRVAECHLALGELMDAALVLGQSNDEEYLALASIIAKQAGDNIMARNIETFSSKPKDSDKSCDQISDNLPTDTNSAAV